MSAAGALVVAVALAGCGQTTYFAGRLLPPSRLVNRVLIAVQNPSAFTRGELVFVDAFYDIRYSYDFKVPGYNISGYSGSLPATIQNMPEEQLGAVYGAGDGSLALINYAKESSSGTVSGLNGLSSSAFVTRNEGFAFAANQTAHVFTAIDRVNSRSSAMSLPGVYRVSVNPGGTVALAFVQNSDYIYYARQLTASQTIAYSGGASTWPRAAVDCEPQNGPLWCLFQAQSPDNVDATGNYYGTPLVFDRPVKAIFSADGGTAYVLNCGQECGGSASSVSVLPVAPLIFSAGQQSGKLPATGAGTTIPIPGGASNALVADSTMYVVGQQLQPDGLFTGNLTVVNLANNTVTTAAGISDGAPGAMSRMILADDNTLWVGMTKCNNGERYAKGLPYGCLTMFNTSSNSVTMLEPYLGDLTGIADVEGLHKVYVAQGGQVYIYSTKDGASINNQYVTVTGTAYDVAYMDGHTDANNTVY
ncbi:MAG: hypothetical protein KGM96_11930 [Acidobacteriota bacterium]|nr:hypothetical protein [Acidobacteriota bacterium]